MPARKPRPDEKPQSERFIETAREIGVDETPEAFERVFRTIVKSGPKSPTTHPDQVKPGPRSRGDA